MNPAVFRTLIAIDPAVLLQSDVISAKPDDRAALVTSLLQVSQSNRFVDVFFSQQTRYQHLNHPKLKAQLEPALLDKSAGFEVRRLAIDIARECQVSALQTLLADIALDGTEQLRIRENAAHAVTVGVDPAIKLRLRGLLDNSLDEDLKDQLRGYALTTLWPDFLNAEAVFRFITVPKRQDFFGVYKHFLSGSLVQSWLLLAIRCRGIYSQPELNHP